MRNQVGFCGCGQTDGFHDGFDVYDDDLNAAALVQQTTWYWMRAIPATCQAALRRRRIRNIPPLRSERPQGRRVGAAATLAFLAAIVVVAVRVGVCVGITVGV
jgi:hypothetical protein